MVMPAPLLNNPPQELRADQSENNWVAVKELKLSYYTGETLLFIIYTHYGNLSSLTATQTKVPQRKGRSKLLWDLERGIALGGQTCRTCRRKRIS